jgi:DNA repair protein RAD50
VFASPLTIIIGENGSGKTTVIESLKYALTGEPAGDNAIVHDPNIFGTTKSIGQIQLQVSL